MLGALMLAGLAVASPQCDGEAMRLDWVRAPGAQACPDGAEVARRIRALVGCDPFGLDPSLRFEVWVAAKKGEWVARVLRLDEAGERIGDTELSTDDEDCVVLAEAVTLAVSVVVEPGDPEVPRTTETSSISVLPSPTTTATVTRRIILVPAAGVDVRPPSPDVPRMSVTAAVAMNSGTLPGPTAGVSLSGQWPLHRYFRVGADLLVLPTRRWGSYGFGLVAGALAACPTAPLGRWTVGGCARGYLGSLTSVVYPNARPDEPAGPYLWAGVGGSLLARYSVTPHVFVSAELEGVAALPRREFTATRNGPVQVVEEVHAEAPVAFFGRFGAGVRFGE